MADDIWPKPHNVGKYDLPPVDWKKRHMGTKNNPGDFDCYAKAMDDEPMFTLLARDPASPNIIVAWAAERIRMIERGDAPASDNRMISEALDCAANMQKWRRANEGAWRTAPLLDRLDNLKEEMRRI